MAKVQISTHTAKIIQNLPVWIESDSYWALSLDDINERLYGSVVLVSPWEFKLQPHTN